MSATRRCGVVPIICGPADCDAEASVLGYPYPRVFIMTSRGCRAGPSPLGRSAGLPGSGLCYLCRQSSPSNRGRRAGAGVVFRQYPSLGICHMTSARSPTEYRRAGCLILQKPQRNPLAGHSPVGPFSCGVAARTEVVTLDTQHVGGD